MTETMYPLILAEVLAVQFADRVADVLPQTSPPFTAEGAATVAVPMSMDAAVTFLLKDACAGCAGPRPPDTTATVRASSSRPRRMPVMPGPPLRGWGARGRAAASRPGASGRRRAARGRWWGCGAVGWLRRSPG